MYQEPIEVASNGKCIAMCTTLEHVRTFGLHFIVPEQATDCVLHGTSSSLDIAVGLRIYRYRYQIVLDERPRALKASSGYTTWTKKYGG